MFFIKFLCTLQKLKRSNRKISEKIMKNTVFAVAYLYGNYFSHLFCSQRRRIFCCIQDHSIGYLSLSFQQKIAKNGWYCKCQKKCQKLQMSEIANVRNYKCQKIKYLKNCKCQKIFRKNCKCQKLNTLEYEIYEVIIFV